MEPVAEARPDSSTAGYAFITHSQETLPLNLPPSIDNATLARRRRRRTSAHDQAILEEEYRKCDRPDKTKRREITVRVQMGEKEVQIWFQNKRQSTRRKSKPLLPHEIIPHSNAESHASNQGTCSSQQSSLDSSQEQICQFFSIFRAHRDRLSEGDCPSSQFVDMFSDDVLGSQGGGDYLGVSDADDDDEEEPGLSKQPYEAPLSKPPTGQRNNPSSQVSVSSPPGPEQNHPVEEQHQASLNHDISAQVTMTTSAHNRLQRVLSSTPAHPKTSRRRAGPITPNNNPPRLLKRPSSIRLSTSLEGKASVVLEDEPSSPPAPITLPTPKPQSSSVTRSALKRRTIDSKIWEFCCDNQAVIRSPCQPCIEPSEATEALSLLRRKDSSQGALKNGSGNPLGTAKSKMVPVGEVPSSSPIKAKKNRKVISGKSTRPKPAVSSSKKSRPAKSATLRSLPEPGQDSDKENRPPGAPVSPPPESRSRVGVSGKGAVGGSLRAVTGKGKPPRKKPTPTKEKGVLEESKTIPSQSASIGTFYDMPPPSSSQVHESEFDDMPSGSQQTFNDESSQGSTRAPPARVDEMECVENLLSLRGGTWG